MSIRFYKDKAYFTMTIKGQCIMARAACIILKYKKSADKLNNLKKEIKDNIIKDDTKNTLKEIKYNIIKDNIIKDDTIKDESFILSIKEKKDFVEFPGGKVEIGDLDIYDTMFRELWEEIILKDELGAGNHKHLKNWTAIRDTIMNSNDSDEQLCFQIYNALKKSSVVSYGGVLKTVYFIIDINQEQAEYFIKKHNAIPISTDVIKHITDSNKPFNKPFNKQYNKTYKGKNTYFHDMCNENIYRIRGRDFDGLSRVVHLL